MQRANAARGRISLGADERHGVESGLVTYLRVLHPFGKVEIRIRSPFLSIARFWANWISLEV